MSDPMEYPQTSAGSKINLERKSKMYYMKVVDDVDTDLINEYKSDLRDYAAHVVKTRINGKRETAIAEAMLLIGKLTDNNVLFTVAFTAASIEFGFNGYIHTQTAKNMLGTFENQGTFQRTMLFGESVGKLVLEW